MPVSSFIDEAELGILTANVHKLQELSRLPIDLSQSSYHYVAFTFLKSIAMSASNARGELDESRHTAQLILDHEDVILTEGLNTCICYFHPLSQAHDMIGSGALAKAYAVMGDNDKSRRLYEELAKDSKLNPVTRVRILAATDLTLAVDTAFEELAKNPGWKGFDVLAAYFVFNREILTHPKVQAHYQQEGKWIEYLSARMPEYGASR